MTLSASCRDANVEQTDLAPAPRPVVIECASNRCGLRSTFHSCSLPATDPTHRGPCSGRDTKTWLITHRRALDTARPGKFVVVVPKIDLVDLLELRGEGPAPQLPLLPTGLTVTQFLDKAVDLVEREVLTRALAASDRQERVIHWEPTFVLTAMTSRYALARLRMVLDAGSGYGVAAVFLGHWRPGSTVSVWPGGQVCAPGPGLGRVMHEVWLGDMGAARAVEQLIRIARRERGPSRPSGVSWKACQGGLNDKSLNDVVPGCAETW